MSPITSCILLLSTTLAQPTPAVSESVVLTTKSTQQANAAAAVVQIPSHGISGTVIFTEPGRTLILSCAHGYVGRDDKGRLLRDLPMTLNVPTATTPTGVKRAAIRLLALGRPQDDDLALIDLGDGPLPWVCAVAPRGHVPGRSTLSVGYDDMKWPATERSAMLLTSLTPTRERPWHGRSGGALIDQAGVLIGVCHGYTGPPTRQEVVRGGQGLYVSHATICAFLDRVGYGWLIGAATLPVDATSPQEPPGGLAPEQLRQQLEAIQQQLAVLQRQVERMQGGYTPAPVPRTVPQQQPNCPDGRCPLNPPPPPRGPPVIPPGRQ